MKRITKRYFLNFARFSFIIKGLVLGVIVGIVVSLFRLTIEKMMDFVKWSYHIMGQKPQYIVLWVGLMIVISFITGKLIKADPNIKGSGIPQVEGQLAGELEMNWWSVLWRKWIGGVLGIGSGLFLGREGPSIQLGAALGHGFADLTKKRGSAKRVLIAGGSAAGLSAAFNAPIAGTLFVLEEVYHNFSPLIWTTALASAVSSNYISMNFFGLEPVLKMEPSRVFPLKYYWHLLLVGIFLGLLGLLYQYMTLNSSKIYDKIKFLPEQYRSIIPLLLIIPIGLFLPLSLGGGNGLIINVVDLPVGLMTLLGIFVLRIVFSTVCYGTGLPGGIFLPILTLGAILGAIYGRFMVDMGLLPQYLVVDFVIYSMSGYFAGIGKAPFTAILLITEMVGSLHHLMPLAVVTLTAYAVVDLLGGAPIYEAMLSRLLKKDHKEVQGDYSDRLEIPVFAGSYIQGKQVRDIKWPNTCLLISIRRGEKNTIPHGDTLIHSGDTLVLLTTHANRCHVREKISTITNKMVEN